METVGQKGLEVWKICEGYRYLNLVGPTNMWNWFCVQWRILWSTTWLRCFCFIPLLDKHRRWDDNPEVSEVSHGTQGLIIGQCLLVDCGTLITPANWQCEIFKICLFYCCFTSDTYSFSWRGCEEILLPPVCVVVLFHLRYNSTNNGLLNFYLICQFIIYHCVSSVYFTQLICVYVIKSSPCNCLVIYL